MLLKHQASIHQVPYFLIEVQIVQIEVIVLPVYHWNRVDLLQIWLFFVCRWLYFLITELMLGFLCLLVQRGKAEVFIESWRGFLLSFLSASPTHAFLGSYTWFANQTCGEAFLCLLSLILIFNFIIFVIFLELIFCGVYDCIYWHGL